MVGPRFWQSSDEIVRRHRLIDITIGTFLRLPLSCVTFREYFLLVGFGWVVYSIVVESAGCELVRI